MTLDDLKSVKMGGVTCFSDMGLYYSSWGSNYIKLLSIYGSPQEVKAILSGIASGKHIVVSGIGGMRRYIGEGLKLRMVSIGYGKRNGLLRSLNLGENIIFWFSPEEKRDALILGLSKRKIPFSPELVPEIEKLLVETEYFEELRGWGGVFGYQCNWNDDQICNLIGKNILGRKGKRNGAKAVSREVWREVGFQG